MLYHKSLKLSFILCEKKQYRDHVSNKTLKCFQNIKSIIVYCGSIKGYFPLHEYSLCLSKDIIYIAPLQDSLYNGHNLCSG